MELSTLWGGMVSFIILLLGWNWHIMYKRMDDMESRHTRALSDAIQTYQNSVNNCDMSHNKMQDIVTGIQINYVHKEEMREMKKELLGRLDYLADLIIKGNKE